MPRWKPDARARLQEAAYALFKERGYGGTTVEDIAARAGVTSRTFFRHFADKREVLFAGTDALAKLAGQTIAAAPKGAGPLEAVMSTFEAFAPHLELPRPQVRERRALIAQDAELRERELAKLTAIAEAATEALIARGIAKPTARLAAELGMTVFRVGFDRWLDDNKARDLATNLRLTLEGMKKLTKR